MPERANGQGVYWPPPRPRIPPVGLRRYDVPCDDCGATERDEIRACGCREWSLEEAQMCESWGSRSCPLP